MHFLIPLCLLDFFHNDKNVLLGEYESDDDSIGY
jgi:hypothetical protein